LACEFPAPDKWLFHVTHILDGFPSMQWKPPWERHINLGVNSVIGVIMEFITKKIRKSSIGRLRRLQAREMFRRGEKVSEADIIDEALETMEKAKFKKKNGTNLSMLYGTLDFGGKTDITKELDDVVYR
jgi:hypothetical protein